jgi:predicted hydrocarbon binding protein
MKVKKTKSTLQEALRRYGHMLASREMNGDNSKEYLEKKENHERMLKVFYKS